MFQRSIIAIRSEAGTVYSIDYHAFGDIAPILLDQFAGRGEVWSLIRGGSIHPDRRTVKAAKFNSVEEWKRLAFDREGDPMYYYDEVTRTWFSGSVVDGDKPFDKKVRFAPIALLPMAGTVQRVKGQSSEVNHFLVTVFA